MMTKIFIKLFYYLNTIDLTNYIIRNYEILHHMEKWPRPCMKDYMGMPSFSPLDLNTLFQTEFTAGASKRVAPTVLALAGGGGGVGKTILATLISLELARSGYETVLVDVDFASSRLLDRMAQKNPEKNLHRFLEGRNQDINALTVPTVFRHLRLITASPVFVTFGHILLLLKQKLAQQLRHLQAHYLVLDLGAGSTFAHLDFFLNADHPLIVTTCEKESLLEAYELLRVGQSRKLQKAAQDWPELYQLFQQCGDLSKAEASITVNEFLLQHAKTDSRFTALIQNSLTALRPAWILNKRRREDDVERAYILPILSREILNLPLQKWGEIRYEDRIKMASQSGNSELLAKECRAGEEVLILLKKNLPLP